MGPRRAPSASPGAATAAAEGRESAKYRAHTKPSHTRTSPPKPYPAKAAFPEGRPRPVRPPAPKRTPQGITLPQLQRQRDARGVIQEGGDGARAGQGAGHGSAGRGAEGDGGIAQGRTQGTGQGAHGKQRGRGHAHGTKASGSGGGQAHGARAERGQRAEGHKAQRGAGARARERRGHEQQPPGTDERTRAGGSGAHGAGQGAGSERGHSQGHGPGHGRITGVDRTGKGEGDRGRNPRQGPEGKVEGLRPNQGLGAGRGPRGKGGKGDVGS